MFDVFSYLAGALSAFVGTAIGVYYYLKARLTSEEIKEIVRKAKAVYEQYKSAKERESEGGEEITVDEWISIARAGAELAETIFKALESLRRR